MRPTARVTPAHIKCKGCGRERVAITKKGYLKPHMTPGGLRCMFILVLPSQVEHTPTRGGRAW